MQRHHGPMIQCLTLLSQRTGRQSLGSCRMTEHIDKIFIVQHLHIHILHTEGLKAAKRLCAIGYLNIVPIAWGMRRKHNDCLRLCRRYIMGNHAIGIHCILNNPLLSPADFRKDNRRVRNDICFT